MSDDPEKPSRPGGRRPGGSGPGTPRGRGGPAGKQTGTGPGRDGKPRAASFGGKGHPAAPGGKPRFAASDDKPRFAASGDRPRSAAPGDKPRFAASGDRPRSAAPGDKPRSAAPGDRPRFAAPGGKGQGDRPFRTRSDGPSGRTPGRDGERAPFKPRDKAPGRSFGKPDDGEARREFRPRGEGGDRRPGRSEPGDRPPRDAGGPAGRGPEVEYRRSRPRPEVEETSAGGEPERIAKRLARAGIASRRDAETLIAAGRVRLNGAILASPAVNVGRNDVIEIDGVPLPPIERTRLFLFHKPAGVVTTNRDPEGRKTVFDVLPADLPRLITVGRLDINTEGLLLLTNDGGLARTLELPSTGWLRRYRVRVHGTVDEARLGELKNGIAVDGVFYGAVEAALERVQGTNAWLTVGIREGKNREVKAIMGALGLEVNRLIRISFGPFQLAELEPGHVLEVKGRTLRDQLGERLIEESGANFEAEIVKPFSNRPKFREAEPERPAAAPVRKARIQDGGLIKARDQARQEHAERKAGGGPRGGSRGAAKPRDREEILDRLQTAPGRAGPGKREGAPGRDQARPSPDQPRPPRDKGRPPREGEEKPRGRTSNVWMAAGARPQGAGKGPGSDKPGRPPRPDKPSGGPGRSGPRKGGHADRRR
jgi:23S rRNA pseudouridine2605 synthase